MTLRCSKKMKKAQESYRIGGSRAFNTVSYAGILLTAVELDDLLQVDFLRKFSTFSKTSVFTLNC